MEKFVEPGIVLDALLDLEVDYFSPVLVSLEKGGGLLFVLLHSDADDLFGVVGTLNDLAGLVPAVS